MVVSAVECESQSATKRCSTLLDTHAEAVERGHTMRDPNTILVGGQADEGKTDEEVEREHEEEDLSARSS